MARNYILGGQAGTQLQAGKPFFKRIVRKNGTGLVNPGADPGNGIGQIDNPANFQLRAEDPLTCQVLNAPAEDAGKIDLTKPALDWNAGANHDGGELLMIEFPTTLRSVQIQMEHASVGVRAKVMLTAPGQDTKADGTANLATPIADGNYIEISSGETATISSRTKVVFILIQKYTVANNASPVLDLATGLLTAGVEGEAIDAASILVTGVLDHEPTSGGSQAANEPNSIIIDANGEKTLRKIWGATDGIG